ncbi:MAG: type II toxin-antitoxin system VapC family toxin [Oscillochloridaceae bacterium umkhey_bin13]
MKYLIDTNVVSELIKKQPNPHVVRWVDTQDSLQLYLSVITIGEIRKGVEKLTDAARQERIYTWLTSHLLIRFDGRILPIETDTMLIWGALTGRLEKEGLTLAAVDSFIAAIALQHQLIIATRNTSDFQGTGLQLINPWEIDPA